MGEPQHPPPDGALALLKEHAELVAKYPATQGRAQLRAAIARWLEKRFVLPSIDPEHHVLPLNGTREGLFALAQAVVSTRQAGGVICPNPFYQIYEGAALLAGSQPLLLNCDEHNGFLPDIDLVTPAQWQNCQLVYLCTPGNPGGAVMSSRQLQRLIALAHEHNFLIASDECYS